MFLWRGGAGGRAEGGAGGGGDGGGGRVGKTTKDEERKHSIISHNPFANHQSTARPHKWSVQTARRRIKFTEQSKTKGQFLFCFHQCASFWKIFWIESTNQNSKPTAPDNSKSKNDHLNHMNGPIERLHWDERTPCLHDGNLSHICIITGIGFWKCGTHGRQILHFHFLFAKLTNRTNLCPRCKQIHLQKNRRDKGGSASCTMRQTIQHECDGWWRCRPPLVRVRGVCPRFAWTPCKQGGVIKRTPGV